MKYPLVYDVNAAFVEGVKAGALHAQKVYERDMKMFFKKAGLVNPYSQKPITNMSEFYEWYNTNEKKKNEKKYKEQQKSSSQPADQHVLVQADEETASEPSMGFAGKVQLWLLDNRGREITLADEALLCGASLAWASCCMQDDMRRVSCIMECCVQVMLWMNRAREDVDLRVVLESYIHRGFDVAKRMIVSKDKDLAYSSLCDAVEVLLNLEPSPDFFAIVAEGIVNFSEEYADSERYSIPYERYGM